MKAFVAGATGETGRRIVQELVQRHIPVKALVRDAQKAKEILPEGVEIAVGDVLQIESVRAAMADCTVVLCATGAKPGWDVTAPYRVDFEGTKNLVDVAKAQGIEQFVLVSSVGASQLFHPLNLFWLILVWKKQAEEYLQKSGIPYTIVRPGGLKNEDNSDKVVFYSENTLSLSGVIPRQKVAQACVEALREPAARNKLVEAIAKPDAPTKSWAELYTAV